MHSVLVSERRQFHLNECVDLDEGKRRVGFDLRDIRRALRILGPDEFAGEHDVKEGVTISSVKEPETEAEEEQQAEARKARYAEYAARAKARRTEFLVKLNAKIAQSQWTEPEWKAYAAYHRKKTRQDGSSPRI
jgi:hypothetical protein